MKPLALEPFLNKSKLKKKKKKKKTEQMEHDNKQWEPMG